MILKVILYIVLVASLAFSCSGKNDIKEHYFLKGYGHLQFVDSNGIQVPVNYFIRAYQDNGVQQYDIINTSLRLVDRETREGYTGPIRTFHWDSNNLEALFEDGYIYRMRYWHSNRQLAMDADYKTGMGSIRDRFGRLAVTWSDEEKQYWNPKKGLLRRIITDSVISYFDSTGLLDYYGYRTDTAWVSFYPDGNPRFFLPIHKNGSYEGTVRRWYPNGKLRAIGFYKNDMESGKWIEYDSLGSILQIVNYDSLNTN